MVDFPENVSEKFTFSIDPCEVTYFLDEEPLVVYNGLDVVINKVTDHWSVQFDDEELCTKELTVTHSSLTEYKHLYGEGALTLTQPGLYTFIQNLLAYPDIVSSIFAFEIDPCSLTTFLNDDYDQTLIVDGMVVTLPEVTDLWSMDALYDDPDLCDKVFHLLDKDKVEITDYTYDRTTLTVVTPGLFFYYFSLKNYPAIVSQ